MGWPVSLHIFPFLMSLSHSWLTVKKVVAMNCYKDPWELQNMDLWIPTLECQTQNVITTSVMDRNIFASLHNGISHSYHLWGPVTIYVGQVGKLMEGVRNLRSQIWVHILNPEIWGSGHFVCSFVLAPRMDITNSTHFTGFLWGLLVQWNDLSKKFWYRHSE